MANMVTYAVSRIMREIPHEVLYQAFGSNEWYNHLNQLSIEERIRREVINGIVLPDCNIVGGESYVVNLGGLVWQWLENGARIEIPMSMTLNRPISSVLSIETTYRNSEPYGSMPGQPGPTGLNEVYLVGPNVIFTPINPGNLNCFLRCILENDEQLANISQKAMYVFGDLAVLAAKMYVHNKLSVSTTITAMTGGQVDGRLRGIIDGYSDAAQMYGELLQRRIKKIAMIQDRKWHHRFIGMGLND
jgi:hypothetical protein